jgi:hypothetical protein
MNHTVPYHGLIVVDNIPAPEKAVEPSVHLLVDEARRQLQHLADMGRQSSGRSIDGIDVCETGEKSYQASYLPSWQRNSWAAQLTQSAL